MDVQLLSAGYQVRRLDINDTDIIYSLSCENEMFYRYHPPFVTKESIADDIKALPPGKSCDDKYYIGFFDNGVLVAIMDLITGYPTEDTAFIGLFMTDVKYQHRGIGSAIVADVFRCLKQLGYKKVRLGADRENPQSNAFWHKNGFETVSVKDDYNVMELMLQGE